MQVFWYGAKAFPFRLMIIPITVTVGNLTIPWFAWVNKMLFDRLEVAEPATTVIETFFPIFALYIAVFLTEWLAWRVAEIANQGFQPYAMKRLVLFAFDRLFRHSYQFFSDNFAGSLIKKIGRLASGFERFADEITFKLLPVTVVVIATIVAFGIQYPLLAVIFVAWAVFFFTVQLIMTAWALRADSVRAELDSKASGVLSDAVTNAITIKSHATQDYEHELLNAATGAYANAQKKSWGRHSIIFAVQSMLMLSLELVLMYIGVNLWIADILTIGDLVFIQTYLAVVFTKMWEVSRGLRHIFDSLVDAREIVEIIHTPTSVKDKRGAKQLVVKKGEIVFKDVEFGFQKSTPVLSNLDLTIKPKEKIALVGPSGAGKSTITKLLFRFYDIQCGTITVDKQDIAKVTQDSLREQIALVPQDPILFHRSLLDNIRYGRLDATDEEVIEAAKKAHCHEFIAGLKDGYGTFVGERGIKLSGGERQRVAIARAILRNAPILVLDEATSALDSGSEHLIQEALAELMKNKTVIVIAHRLSTIRMMDRIVVIEGGQITDTGTHRELLSSGGTYNDLWELQAGAFGE